MNIAVRKTWTVSDYLAWADAQSENPRTELINGQIVAMAPERIVHNRLKGSVFVALDNAMKSAGVTGEVFTDGVTVPIDDHTAYEPDALVRCGQPLPGHEMKATDPVIVVEVLSPTSEHSDTSAKLIGYFKLASVRHYLIVDPDAGTVTHHARAVDGTIFANVLSSGTLRFDPPGFAIEVSDIFR